MRRVATLVSILALAACAFGCATYRQDLDRARKHYDDNQYEKALALFRVLEPDVDSLSDPEQAQYAYLRGMTDYRLASQQVATNVSGGVVDPRRAFRDNARHWLAVAAAIEKATPGGLTGDEKKRLEDALTDLNKDVYGGAESTDDKAGGDKKEDKPAGEADKPAAEPEKAAPAEADKVQPPK
ncbi:hypothetical protein [Polyangium aurulentum]|uniref:hypothetical protein n=1 Tax=Polyangium aurulentum TaxID=2567896 RepID=UPI0010AE0F9F|nr:hypothetical protein [Polyangium aurulentum]UQA59543.1 hypothetical protein E8A73_003250 [Polyangium aurulentum]